VQRFINNNGENMTIKITDKILSITPYISTQWNEVASLHMRGETLSIGLRDGHTVEVPNMETDSIHLIFHYHALHVEKEGALKNEHQILDLSQLREIGQEEGSFRLALGASIDGVSNIMQHNPAQSNAPDLPEEIRSKISAIVKIIAPTDDILPCAEPNCNCFFCQIAREFHPLAEVIDGETVVKEEELQFQQWSIAQIGEKLFTVENRLDNFEKYNVYLGEPIGCTCGKERCEHILAVLKT
jgi:hypothetical protein